MAELPGWDRPRLGLAEDADVEAARMIVYARAMRGPVTEDIAGQIEVLEIETTESPKARERKVKSHQRHTLGELRKALARQRTYRGLLGLDDPDEPADPDELAPDDLAVLS